MLFLNCYSLHARSLICEVYNYNSTNVAEICCHSIIYVYIIHVVYLYHIHTFIILCGKVQKGQEIFSTLQALKRNMVYPHFAYITYGGYPEKWWTDEVAGAPMDDPECTNDALNTFIQNARPLQLHFFPEPDDYDLQTDAGFVRTLIDTSSSFLKSLHLSACMHAYVHTKTMEPV